MPRSPRSSTLRRRTTTVATVCVAAAVSWVPGGSPAGAAVRGESYPVPTGRVYTLHGHGFGHGHGMSQYGAYGAARQGLGTRRILRFYYPATRLRVLRPGSASRIRVLLTEDTTRDLVVSPAAGLAVRDLGSGATYRLPSPAGVTRWRLNVSGGRTVVAYRTSRWHRYRPGGRAALVGDGQLRADGPLTLWRPSGPRSYRGSLRAASPGPGSADRDTVNVVGLDDYVRGVLSAEMPASWPRAALGAQAVAARTYAAWSRDEAPPGSYDVCDTSACQVYRGTAAEHPRADAAVAATARRILRYDGRPAFTQFSSSSGGWTAAGSRPYLVARADPYDGHAANPVHDWTVRLGAARLQAAYPGIGRLQRLVVTRRDGHGQWGGRVERIVLDGRRRDVALSGDTFRSVFGLRSTWFTPRPR